MPLFAEEGIWVDAGALTRSCLTQLFATMDSGTLWTSFPYQCPGFGSQGSKSSHKIRAVCLIIDNLPLFNASYHHVVQRPWTIEPRMSRHIFCADSDPLCHLSS
jgi:hypothetical protein